MHFSSNVGPVGPLITVLLQESAARRAALAITGGTVAPPVVATLLVDTGASMTCLDQPVIQQLGLHPTGSMGVLTPSTGAAAVQVSTYDVEMVLPGSHGNVSHTIPNLAVTACNLAGQPIDGLIGRDILALARMTYSGPDDIYLLSF